MSIEKLKVESHRELERLVTSEISKVEKNLTVICNDIPVNDKATLDILCHDENGQLVIIKVSVEEDDAIFLHGIQSIDYVDKFKPFLKATYNKHKIDDKAKPRLILIASSFSDALRLAVESMKGIRVDLYEWEYLKLGDQKGLHLQPIFTLMPEKPKEKEETPIEKKREPKPLKKKESTQAVEKKEAPKPELPAEPEPPKEKLPPFPPPPEPKEEKLIKQEQQEQPKKKLKLF